MATVMAIVDTWAGSRSDSSTDWGIEMASEQGVDFDAKREAYVAARRELDRVIDDPDKSLPVKEYRDQLVAADTAVNAAHEAMMAAWA